jgi:DNA-binding NarL/FixJ family response regulator
LNLQGDAEARIVVLTTDAGDVQVLRALKAGARAYIESPFLVLSVCSPVSATRMGTPSS